MDPGSEVRINGELGSMGWLFHLLINGLSIGVS